MPKKLKLVSEGGIIPPRPLGDAGQSLWDRVQAEYVVADAGGLELLRLACEACGRAEACRAQIDADGLVIVSATGAVRDHPLLKHELAARALVSRLVMRLGLDVEPPGRIGRPPGPAGWTG